MSKKSFPANEPAQNSPEEPEEESSFCNVPINIELGLQIDKSLVDAFDGDVEAARSFALDVYSSARDIWFNIGLAQFGYSIFVNFVWFPMPYMNPSQDLFQPTPDTWGSKIIGDWNRNRPCIKKDGIVYLTGRSNIPPQPTVRGYALNLGGRWLCKEPTNENGNRVAIACLRRNSNGSPSAYLTSITLAHEIGHLFGIQHEDQISSSGGCEQSPCQDINGNGFLMCTSSSGTILSSCMISRLNNNFSNTPGLIRCPCLTTKLEIPSARCERPTLFSHKRRFDYPRTRHKHPCKQLRH